MLDTTSVTTTLNTSRQKENLTRRKQGRTSRFDPRITGQRSDHARGLLCVFLLLLMAACVLGDGYSASALVSTGDNPAPWLAGWESHKQRLTPRPVALSGPKQNSGSVETSTPAPASATGRSDVDGRPSANDPASGPVTEPESPELPQTARTPSVATPDLRLDGKQVTTESLAGLSGRAWGTVTLADVRFNGTIVESLRHAESIRALRLFGTEISGQIPRLKHISGLVGLELAGPFTGGGVIAVSELTQLEHLVLPQELTINVTGARAIARMVNLRSLGMYNVNLDDASFSELRTLVNLEELDLTHTSVTDQGLNAIAGMPHLRRIELDRYRQRQFPVPQLTDACVPLLVKLPQLESLSISGEITDRGLQQLAGLPRLKRLSIVHTDISAAGLSALENSTVETLVMGPMGLDSLREFGSDTHPVLESLRKCRNLKRVQIIGRIEQVPFEVLQKVVPGVEWSFQS